MVMMMESIARVAQYSWNVLASSEKLSLASSFTVTALHSKV